ncbi:MAG: GNAT family N-acetyltransferase [Candidatus Sericytochromatia bacterium]|nr:GNAT family N-acetyltransferase [Candidatus Sericytochromatia bacterium]
MNQDSETVSDSDMAAMVLADSGTAERLASFGEAQRHPHGAIILRSTMKDLPYVVCHGAMVACSEETLWQLLSDLDHIICCDSDDAMPELLSGDRLSDGGPSGGAVLHCEILALAAGGMWVHPDFQARGVAEAIIAVIEGKQLRLGPTEVPAAPDDAILLW